MRFAAWGTSLQAAGISWWQWYPLKAPCNDDGTLYWATAETLQLDGLLCYDVFNGAPVLLRMIQELGELAGVRWLERPGWSQKSLAHDRPLVVVEAAEKLGKIAILISMDDYKSEEEEGDSVWAYGYHGVHDCSAKASVDSLLKQCREFAVHYDLGKRS